MLLRMGVHAGTPVRVGRSWDGLVSRGRDRAGELRRAGPGHVRPERISQVPGPGLVSSAPAASRQLELPERRHALGVSAGGRVGAGEAEGLCRLRDRGFVLLPAKVPRPARRPAGTAVNRPFGPLRVSRAGQRIIVRAAAAAAAAGETAGAGARPSARLGGLTSGVSRLRCDPGRLHGNRDRGRLCRRRRQLRGLDRRYRGPLGRAGPRWGVCARTPRTPARARHASRRPSARTGIRLRGTRGRRQRFIRGQVVPELLIGNAAEGLHGPEFPIDVGALAPAHAPPGSGRVGFADRLRGVGGMGNLGRTGRARRGSAARRRLARRAVHAASGHRGGRDGSSRSRGGSLTPGPRLGGRGRRPGPSGWRRRRGRRRIAGPAARGGMSLTVVGPGRPAEVGGRFRPGAARGPASSAFRPSGSGGARGRGMRGPVSASPGPAGSGSVRSGSSTTGTAWADAEVEGRRDTGKSRDGECRDQNHGLHPECRASWRVLGTLARHTRPMTRAFPRSRERPRPA